MTVRRLGLVLLVILQAWACAWAQTPVLGRNVPGPPPTNNRTTVSVKTPSYSVFANAVNDPAIVTWAAYGANSAAWTTATHFVTTAGASHHAAEFNWDELEPTQGNYTWTLLDRFVRDTGTLPLIIKISPIGSDGNRHTPSDLNGLTWDNATLSNAYNAMLDAVAPRLQRRLWVLAIGNEMDTYFLVHNAEIAPYGAFVSRTAPHARIVFGSNPFKVTACFTSNVLTTWIDYSAITVQLDVNYFSYFVGGSSNLPVDFGNMGLRGPFALDFGAPSNTPVLGSSEALQALLVQAMIGYAEGTGKLIAASYFQLAEISTAVLASFGSTTPALELVQSLGLIDLNGDPKPGWQIMLEVLQGQVTPPPPTITVQRPSYSIVANAADDPAIVTASAYRANTTGQIAAQAKTITAGADHLQAILKWSDVEPTTVGVYDFSKVDTFVANSGTLPLILNLAPIWDDGTKSVPTALTATAWDAHAMSNAYLGMLTALSSHVQGRLWILGVGNEIDVYLSAHPTEIPQFATFLSRLRTPARTLYGTNPFSITTTFRSTAVDSWSNYTSILLFTDLESFTYYPVADSNLSTTVVADITHLFGIVGNGPVMFQEIGVSSSTVGSSEAIQAQGVALIFTALSNYAHQGDNIVAMTWASLDDLSAAVISSFGYSSGQLTAGIGLRTTSNAAKQAWPLIVGYLGGDPGVDPPTTCTYTLSKTSQSFTTAAGSGSFVITTGATCAWTLSVIGGTPAWLTIGPASGTGTATISYSVLVNATTTGRNATAVIGGQQFSVSQDGAIAPPPPPVCTFTLASSSDTFTASSGSRTVAMTANDSTCTWTVAILDGAPSWFGVSPLSGAGNQTFTYTVTANTTEDGRAVRFQVGANGPIFSVAQSGTVQPPPPPPANCTSTTPSKTGFNSVFYTPCHQDTWDGMYADYLSNPTSPTTLGGQTVRWLIQQANQPNPTSPTNFGGFAGVPLYQITGDPQWVEKAWATIQDKFIDQSGQYSNGNFWRENFLRQIVFYNILSPGLSSARRTTYINALNAMADAIVTQYQAGLRIEDSDQTGGAYFGLAALKALTGSTNAHANTVFANAFVGGYTATAEDFLTLRNAIKKFFNTMARGGEYIESSEYNPGTLQILMLGYGALLAAQGTDNFPEITTWLQTGALRWIYFTTPGRTQPVQWSDDENIRTLRLGDHLNWTASEIEALTDATTAGPYLQDLILDLVAQYGSGPSDTANASIGRDGVLMGFNPNAVRGSTAFLPSVFYAAGQGFLIDRDMTDTLATGSEFVGHCLNTTTFVDHQPSYWCDARLWRKGEWAIDHPISYAGSSLYGDGTNSVEFKDLMSSSGEYKKITSEEAGTSPIHYTYMAATTGGAAPLVSQTGFFQPPPYLQEFTRSMVYLPSSAKTIDAVAIFDRIYVKEPSTLASYDNYGFFVDQVFGNNKAVMDAAPSRSRWHFHMPVSPTIVGSEITWTTPGGQHLALTNALPIGATRTPVNESTLTKNMWNSVVASEKKWEVEITQTPDVDWMTGFNVIRAFDTGATNSVTTINDSEGVQGGVIHRQGENDVALLFNGRQGTALGASFAAGNQAILDCDRFFQTGWTNVDVPTTTATSYLGLFDFDAGGSGTYVLDGAAPVALVPSANGVKWITLTGISTHTLAVTWTGSGVSCAPVSGPPPPTSEVGQNSITRNGTATEQASVSGAATGITLPYTTPNVVNRYNTIAVVANQTDTVTGCTYAGNAATQVDKVLTPGNDRYLYLYGILAPTTGANNWVCSSSAPTILLVKAQGYAGVDQTTPIKSTEHTAVQIASPNILSADATVTRTNSWSVLVARNWNAAAVAGSGSFDVCAVPSPGCVPGSNGLSFFDSNGPHTTAGTYTMQGHVDYSVQWGAIIATLNPLVGP